LLVVAGRAAARLRNAFAEAGMQDIRPAHAATLVPLLAGPLHASAVAERLAVSRQAVAQAVRPLERHGYVTRSPDAADSRVLLIALTPRGRQALRIMRANALAVEHDWQLKLGEKRLNELRATLKLLLDAETCSDIAD
jgi:DNA-binding MarR family transcriptional regulator